MCKLLSFVIAFVVGGCVLSAHAQVVDPTHPLGASPVVNTGENSGAAAQGITLSSILIASDRKLAIINGQTLHENQVLKGVGAVVKKIDADSVTLEQGGKVWRLPLNKIVIRK